MNVPGGPQRHLPASILGIMSGGGSVESKDPLWPIEGVTVNLSKIRAATIAFAAAAVIGSARGLPGEFLGGGGGSAQSASSGKPLGGFVGGEEGGGPLALWKHFELNPCGVAGKLVAIRNGIVFVALIV